jgi:hypothetical protein
MANLAGLHDIEATAIAAPDTWVLDTVAMSENPASKQYPANLNVITRINWGYGSAGTLPLPSVYEAFAQRVAQYVNGASGCRRWIIGNECNLSREWPDGQPIFPWHYAACYKLCRDAIHALPGHVHDEVLLAGSGPWNDELKYTGNAGGDWITYFEDTIRLCDDDVDGFAIHAYTHGYDVGLVTSTARMDEPFQNRFYNFLTYQDYCEAIPHSLRHLPVYITEANGNGPWQAVGLMPAMLEEIDGWNQSKLPRIHCVIFFRYPRYDQFFIEGRNDVIAEYRAAVARGYQSPGMTPPTPQPPEPPRPTPPTPEPEPVEWDDRLTIRRCTRQPAIVPAGELTQQLLVGRWFDEDEAQGRVNIYVRVLDENGNLAVGVPVTQFWSSGSATRLTERKADPWLASMGLGAEYSLDFAMYEVAPSYGIRIDDGHANDIINGCGLGSIEEPHYKIHTAYFFEWQLSSGSDGSGSGELPVPTPPDPLPPWQPGGGLVHPLPGAVITQHWGEDGASYARFGLWGHNGCDLGGRPLRTPIRSIARGIVAYSDFDAAYGFYCRVDHPELECYSMYCHMDEPGAPVGQALAAGDTVGLLGTSGNSSGPHLHLEIRLHNVDGTYREDTPMPKGRVDPETWCILHGLKL